MLAANNPRQALFIECGPCLRLRYIASGGFATGDSFACAAGQSGALHTRGDMRTCDVRRESHPDALVLELGGVRVEQQHVAVEGRVEDDLHARGGTALAWATALHAHAAAAAALDVPGLSGGPPSCSCPSTASSGSPVSPACMKCPDCMPATHRAQAHSAGSPGRASQREAWGAPPWAALSCRARCRAGR